MLSEVVVKASTASMRAIAHLIESHVCLPTACTTLMCLRAFSAGLSLRAKMAAAVSGKLAFRRRAAFSASSILCWASNMSW